MKFNIKYESTVPPRISLCSVDKHSAPSFSYFSPSLVSEFLTSVIVGREKQQITIIQSDIQLIMKLRSGQELPPELAEELLKREIKYDDSIEEIFDRATDQDLFNSIKSRYIQSPSELETYIRSLDDSLSDLSTQELNERLENGEVNVDGVESAESSSDDVV